MMDRGKLVAGIMLASALMMTGCAGKVRIASSKTCMAHGGKYDASAHACTYQASTKTAKQSCEASGGYYDIGADVCEMGQE